jgi:alkaline phosphatase
MTLRLALLVIALSLPFGTNGSQAQTIPQENDAYFTAANQQLARRLAVQPRTGRAKNVILFVGDGMSVATVTASRIHEGQKRNVDGEANNLTIDSLPYVALSKTYSHNGQVADSAPTASAMMTGVKLQNGVLGLNATVAKQDCRAARGQEVASLAAMAERAGMSTGVVSTAKITHATPAAVYAHTAFRGWEDDSAIPADCKSAGTVDIAAQLVRWPHGDGLEVALGGGRQHFLPDHANDPEDEGRKGTRKDGQDLTKAWTDRYSSSGAVVWSKEQFDNVNVTNTKHLLGLFDRSHMEYEADRGKDKAGEPSLAEMASKAIEMLAQNQQGYFLMVEAGRIDHAHHAGNAYRALEDTVALDAAVSATMQKVNLDDTLIIVTADHSHTLTMSGYPKRGNPILGVVIDEKSEVAAGTDGKPYTTLGYANGPGATKGEARADIANVDTRSPDYIQQALVPSNSATHAGDDVIVYAVGPWAHLFQGTVEQNYVFHVMDYASKISERAAKSGR